MVRCLRCGRNLTNPDSVRRKYGPVCWRKLFGRPQVLKREKLKNDLPEVADVVEWLRQQPESNIERAYVEDVSDED